MVNLSSFDLNLLRVLDALLRENSVTRAAQRVGLSQPAMSAALARLREALGDPILIRHGQRLQPTDFARSLALPLHEALAHLQTLLAGPQAFDPATADTTFRLTGSDLFAALLMPPLARHLATAAPGVRVQLVDLVPENYVETLERYEVDIALIPGTEFPDWTDHLPVLHSDFVTIAAKANTRLARAGIAPGTTIPLDLYCDLGHVVFSPEAKLRALGDAALSAIGRSRRVVMTLPAFADICLVVAQTDHIALVPRPLAESLAPTLGLAVFGQPVAVPRATISMVWHRRSTADPGQRWLRGTVADQLTRLEPASTTKP